MVSQILAGLPWVWPTIAATVAVAVLTCHGVAHRMRTTSIDAFLLLVSVGGIIALTLTPAAHLSGAQPYCQVGSLRPIPLHDLLSVNERSLNVLLFVPLGIAVGLLPGSKVKAGVLILAVGAPGAIEFTQYVAPELGRQCQAVDVIDNLTGLGAGLTLAGLATLIRAHGRSRSSDVPTDA